MSRSGRPPHWRLRARVILPLVTAALTGSVWLLPTDAHAVPPALAAAQTGHVLGGVTAQGWPIVIELNRTGRQIGQALVGMDLKCTSGDQDSFPYSFRRVSITKQGRFRYSFTPQTQRLPDGTTEDYAGGISGQLNRTGTTASGRWQFKETFYDNTGALSDTCESSNVGWSAKA